MAYLNKCALCFYLVILLLLSLHINECAYEYVFTYCKCSNKSPAQINACQLSPSIDMHTMLNTCSIQLRFLQIA